MIQCLQPSIIVNIQHVDQEVIIAAMNQEYCPELLQRQTKKRVMTLRFFQRTTGTTQDAV